MFQNTKLHEVLGDLETFGLIVACFCHDLDHRGTNNSFQIKYALRAFTSKNNCPYSKGTLVQNDVYSKLKFGDLASSSLHQCKPFFTVTCHKNILWCLLCVRIFVWVAPQLSCLSLKKCMWNRNTSQYFTWQHLLIAPHIWKSLANQLQSCPFNHFELHLPASFSFIHTLFLE